MNSALLLCYLRVWQVCSINHVSLAAVTQVASALALSRDAWLAVLLALAPPSFTCTPAHARIAFWMSGDKMAGLCAKQRPRRCGRRFDSHSSASLRASFFSHPPTRRLLIKFPRRLEFTAGSLGARSRVCVCARGQWFYELPDLLI